MATGPTLGATCRARHKLNYRAGDFPTSAVSSFPLGCLAAALIGMGAGGEAAITPYLLTRYFGVRAFSTLCGLTWTFYAAAGAIGPVVLGRAFDATGSYASLLILLAGGLGVNSWIKSFPSEIFRFRVSLVGVKNGVFNTWRNTEILNKYWTMRSD
jgi:MFS family permease